MSGNLNARSGRRWTHLCRVFAMSIAITALLSACWTSSADDDQEQWECNLPEMDRAEDDGDAAAHELVYGVDGDAEDIRDVMEKRLDLLEVASAEVTVTEDGDILVALPQTEAEELEGLRNHLARPGRFRIHVVDDDGTDDFFHQFRGELPEGFELRYAGSPFLTVLHDDREALRDFFEDRIPERRQIGFRHQLVFADEKAGIVDEEASYWTSQLLYDDAELTGEVVESAESAVDEHFGHFHVVVILDDEGTRRFEELSGEYVGQRVAVMLDDEVMTSPVIYEPITGGRFQIPIDDRLSDDEAEYRAREIISLIVGGALPAPVEPR